MGVKKSLQILYKLAKLIFMKYVYGDSE